MINEIADMTIPELLNILKVTGSQSMHLALTGENDEPSALAFFSIDQELNRRILEVAEQYADETNANDGAISATRMINDPDSERINIPGHGTLTREEFEKLRDEDDDDS